MKRQTNIADSNRPALQQYNSTALMLMLQYGSPTVELRTICHLFGFKDEYEANRAASEGRLPITVSKLRDSQKSPYLIHVEDLATFIEQQRQRGAEEQASWTKRRSA
ncbi:Pyocin activator protein PrtN [Amphritea atlantica]|uniref:Pyocin activator protein PrtN n=1 Tax=Amphritea atlantica TaxID=355243 RepID=A0A1H9GDV9_9GAMM|nr:pyocin activator PrtN family protein [Amphritea atlantica]SEQ48291.1 Pyocin activator protein PrtN [Amphritea atlantica]